MSLSTSLWLLIGVLTVLVGLVVASRAGDTGPMNTEGVTETAPPPSVAVTSA